MQNHEKDIVKVNVRIPISDVQLFVQEKKQKSKVQV